MANNLMTHVVAGYPSAEECIELLLGMEKAEVSIIEVQIPFSDPIADGETIMAANDEAIENSMTVEKSFAVIRQARSRGLGLPVYVMSYLQKIVHTGAKDFCNMAADCGISGLIIPDLPFDTDDFKYIDEAAKKFSLAIVPVISPGMTEKRLQAVLGQADDLVYMTSMKGITGKNLLVTDELKQLAGRVKSDYPELDLAIGFGVQDKKDAQEILKIADIAVVGSSVIRQVRAGGVKQALKFIENLSA